MFLLTTIYFISVCEFNMFMFDIMAVKYAKRNRVQLNERTRVENTW